MHGTRPFQARLILLGGDARLLAQDDHDATPHSAKARALLAYLALAPQGIVDRGKVAGLLWCDGNDAKASLRQCIRELRDVTTAAGLRIFAADLHRLTLDLGALWVDALEVLRLAGGADTADPERMTALYAGDLLEGLEVRAPEFELWLTAERSRLREQACRWLERVLRQGVGRGDAIALGRAARALLAVDPAHEEAHRALMRQHALRGDPAAAVRQYLDCRRALARQLDLAPSAETEALLRQIRGGSLHGDATVGKPAAAPASLSVPLGPIVTERWPSRALISVEQRVPLSADPADTMIAAALTARLREALARKSFLVVVDAVTIRSGMMDGAQSSLAAPCYRVELSFLRAAVCMRFCAELMEASCGRILWAEHHDRALSDDHLFDLIDEVATTLAHRLDREVELAEIVRASRRPVEALSAYDLVLRAIPLIFKLTPEAFAEAQSLLLAAEHADPHDPLVFAWRAFWCFLNLGQGWAGDVRTARQELGWIVHRALELDPNNPLALAVGGHVASFVNHDYGRALELLDRSLQADPHSAYAWDLSALTHCYTGNADEGLSRLEKSRNLWQRHPAPHYFRTTACIALMLAGQHERAVELGRQTISENPHFHAPYRPLIASLGHMDRVEEARDCLDRLRQLEPDFSIGWFCTNYPPLHRDYAEAYILGLRKAGVPEE